MNKENDKKVFDNRRTIEPFDINIHGRISTGLPCCENHEWKVFSKIHNDGFLTNSLSRKSTGNQVMLDLFYAGYHKILTELTDHGCRLRKVHMSGLGIGTMIPVIFSYKNVETLNVVEISQSLIDLIGPFYESYISDGKLKIICADARRWLPEDEHYDLAFHDIWTSNKNKERIEIMRAYQDYAKKQVCWTRTWL